MQIHRSMLQHGSRLCLCALVFVIPFRPLPKVTQSMVCTHFAGDQIVEPSGRQSQGEKVVSSGHPFNFLFVLDNVACVQVSANR